MNWKETILKDEQIIPSKFKLELDGKYEIRVGLLPLLEGQAKQSFYLGIQEMLNFASKMVKENKLLTPLELGQFFKECGYPEIADKVQEMKE